MAKTVKRESKPKTTSKKNENVKEITTNENIISPTLEPTSPLFPKYNILCLDVACIVATE